VASRFTTHAGANLRRRTGFPKWWLGGEIPSGTAPTTALGIIQGILPMLHMAFTSCISVAISRSMSRCSHPRSNPGRVGECGSS
jgi:hypothetical protein